MTEPSADERAEALIQDECPHGESIVFISQHRCRLCLVAALHAHAEAARTEIGQKIEAEVRIERSVMGAAAANVFSREIDALGELEKFELAQKIEEEAAAIRAGGR